MYKRNTLKIITGENNWSDEMFRKCRAQHQIAHDNSHADKDHSFRRRPKSFLGILRILTETN